MSQLSENSFESSQPPSAFGLFFSLFSGQWRPGEFWNQRSFRRKFMLRSLLMPRLSREWMGELSQWSNLNILLARQPRLPVRLHRPYLAVNFNRHQVLEALRYHYTLLSEVMSSEESATYLNTQALPLANVEGKNGDMFTFELTMQVNLDKEGDSTILMRNSDGDVLAEMTFSIIAYENKRTLFIGGLQGGKRDLPHEAIQNATKSCHGLFPKRLVMEAVCRFAERLQVEQILAVSNEVHTIHSGRPLAANATSRVISISLSKSRVRMSQKLPVKNAPSTAAVICYWMKFRRKCRVCSGRDKSVYAPGNRRIKNRQKS